MRNTAIARIDLTAVRDNLSIVRSLCPRSRVMAMVKADAYGHGLVRVARALSGADGFAVARLQEALLLRRVGIKQRILLLATLLNAADLAMCSEKHIDITVHDETSLACTAAQARCTPLRVWLKLDSGMHRVGLTPDAFIEADRLLAGHPGILEVTHMTHFSSADNTTSRSTERQLSCFWRCHKPNSSAKASLANSAALITSRETHADWVRPGIMLYGDNPLGESHPVPLRSAMTLCANIIAIREIGSGESVGYNERWTSTRRSRIGTVGIGYGDGYPRHARNGTPVWISERRVPLVGQVSMDSLTVDLTECESAAVGDQAVLWGPELPAAMVAECANTISYELFTSLQSRVTREYTDGPCVGSRTLRATGVQQQ
jgi:alanine racemase